MLNINFWYWERNIENQLAQGIPLNQEGLIYSVVLNGLCLLTYVTYLRAACSDPGQVPEGMKPPFQSDHAKTVMCTQCVDSWKPVRAHHCSTCGICVFKMDHHCLWINNCIGQANAKYFLQFLFYTMLMSLTQVGLCFKSVVNLLKHPRVQSVIYTDEYPAACAGAASVFLLGCFFAYVAFELLREQVLTIEENQGYIDQVNKQFGKQRDFWSSAKQTIGTDFLCWLLPTKPELKTNYFERVWPKRLVKRMYIAQQFDMEEDEADPEQKLHQASQVRASFEKKLIFLLVVALSCFWNFVLKDIALEQGVKQYGWVRPEPPINVLPDSQRN